MVCGTAALSTLVTSFHGILATHHQFQEVVVSSILSNIIFKGYGVPWGRRLPCSSLAQYTHPNIRKWGIRHRCVGDTIQATPEVGYLRSCPPLPMLHRATPKYPMTTRARVRPRAGMPIPHQYNHMDTESSSSDIDVGARNVCTGSGPSLGLFRGGVTGRCASCDPRSSRP